MKKLLTLFLLCVGLSMYATTYSGGSGTEQDPYQIATAADLIELSQTSAHWGTSSDQVYFIQTADIDFDTDSDGELTDEDWNGDGLVDDDDTTGFSPIGSYSTPFASFYDGQNHSINALEIDQEGGSEIVYIGLFGYATQAELKNINLINVDIRVTDINEFIYCGGLVGWSSATIDNCHVSGNIIAASIYNTISDINFTGGLVGCQQGGTVGNCNTTELKVDAECVGTALVGGLIGVLYVNGIVESSFSSAEVNLSAGFYANGGVLIGGAYMGNTIVKDSYASGKISCYSPTGTFTGGLIGYADNNAEISNCHSSGAVEAESENITDIGGLIGEFGGVLSNSYSTGAVIGSGGMEPNSGGLIGIAYSGSSVTDCYYDTNTSGRGDTGIGANYGTATVTGLDFSAFAQEASFTNWQFEGTETNPWLSGSRPYLYWQDITFCNGINQGNLTLGYTATAYVDIVDSNAGLSLTGTGFRYKAAADSLWSTADAQQTAAGEFSITLPDTLDAADTITVQSYAIASDGLTYYGDAFILKNILEEQTIIVTDSIEKTYGDESFSLEATTDGDGTLSYSSDDTDVSTVDASGNVTIVGVGTAHIYVTASETGNYSEAKDTVTITVEKAEGDIRWVLSGGTVSKTTHDDAFPIDAATSTTGTITYSSSNTSVATVDASTGEVTILTGGTTTIIATASDANGNYSDATSSFIVDVSTVTHATANESTTWQVYPNPAQSMVTIEGAQGHEVSILDLSGKVVMSGRQTQFDVSNLSAGMYLVEVKQRILRLEIK